MPQKYWWEKAVSFFAQVSAWIAFPVIIALILGQYLDKIYNTKPYIFLSLTFIAFLISMIALIKKSGEYLKEVEKDNQKNDRSNDRTTSSK